MHPEIWRWLSLFLKFFIKLYKPVNSIHQLSDLTFVIY